MHYNYEVAENPMHILFRAICSAVRRCIALILVDHCFCLNDACIPYGVLPLLLSIDYGTDDRTTNCHYGAQNIGLYPITSTANTDGVMSLYIGECTPLLLLII